MNNHKRAFGHDGKHDNLIIAAAADKNSYCNKNGTHDDCESVVAILCNIYVCSKLATYVVGARCFMYTFSDFPFQSTSFVCLFVCLDMMANTTISLLM